ncbi:MAG TPA: CheR family methyltransferase [Opitutaceae bacterium]|nr:CheR family methyltransferase [Opitutaceae bacterium]
MTAALSEDLVGRLSGFVTQRFGLRFPPDRWNELSRGLASAALELGVSDLQGWAEHLATGGGTEEHLRAVANHLTVAETYFYRHRETFTLLEQKILPARLARRKSQFQPLRIWSAGCASGEEPYSIAILLRRAFSDLRPEQIQLHATDLNTHALLRAQNGVFTEWSFRDTPSWLKDFAFTRRGTHRYELRPEFRSLVRFSRLNLIAPLYPAEFGERADMDLILCRNVLMYFSAEWQRAVIARLAQALAPGGWLIIGPCDFSADQARALHLRSEGAGVFRKGLDSTASTVLSPAPKPLELPLQIEAPAPAPLPFFGLEATPETISTSSASPERLPVDAVANPVVEDARAHANRGELALALSVCEASLGENRTDEEVHYLRGCVLQELGRSEEAAQAFRTVLFLNPQSVLSHLALASLAWRSHENDTSRHHLLQVLRLLREHNPGESVPGSDGITVGRLRSVVESSLKHTAA